MYSDATPFTQQAASQPDYPAAAESVATAHCHYYTQYTQHTAGYYHVTATIEKGAAADRIIGRRFLFRH